MATAYPAGVTGGTGVELTPATSAFLVKLRAAVPASTPIYVTSGYRSPEAQAAALVTKRNLGDNLTALYGTSRIAPILAAANTVAGMSAALREQMRNGLYLSRHMRGDALDFRTTNLTSAQVAEIQRAAEALGAKTLVETTPPHLHVERIGGGLLAIPGAKAAIGIVGILGLGVTGLLIFWFWRYRTRKPQ